LSVPVRYRTTIRQMTDLSYVLVRVCTDIAAVSSYIQMMDVRCFCERCDELWRECARVTQSVADLAKQAERSGVTAPELAAAIGERAAIHAKIKIHLALAHGQEIGRGAARGAGALTATLQ
jgi:hypothetical protein